MAIIPGENDNGNKIGHALVEAAIDLCASMWNALAGELAQLHSEIDTIVAHAMGSMMVRP
jgi:hypothetical protein